VHFIAVFAWLVYLVLHYVTFDVWDVCVPGVIFSWSYCVLFDGYWCHTVSGSKSAEWCACKKQANDEPVPLSNLGNTCFMNSTVQLLAASPQIRSLLLSHLLHHNNTGKHIVVIPWRIQVLFNGILSSVLFVSHHLNHLQVVGSKVGCSCWHSV